MKDLLLYDRPDWMHYINSAGDVVTTYHGLELYTIDAEAVQDAGMENAPDDDVRAWICYEWKDDILDAIERADDAWRHALDMTAERD